MKNFFFLSALISLTVIAACTKQGINDDVVPNSPAPSTVTAFEKADIPATRNTANAAKADFAINNENGEVNEFDALMLTNNSVNAVSYEWNFGNGDKSTEAKPTYKYKMHGNYTVTLTTTDAHGNTQQASHEIVVLCIFGGGSHDN